MGNETDVTLDELWDDAFEGGTADEDDISNGGDPETGNAETDTDAGTDDNTDTDTGTDTGTDTDINTDGGEASEEDGEGGADEGGGSEGGNVEISAADLAEINQVLGTEYSSAEEFPEARRFSELRERGRFSVREAAFAVTGDSRQGANGEASGRSSGANNNSNGKGHIHNSRGKGSSGEVYGRAEKEEIAKWGFKSEGAALERLWRNAK